MPFLVIAIVEGWRSKAHDTSLALNGISSAFMCSGGRRLREKDWQSSTLWSVLSRGAVGSLYRFTFVSG